MSVFILDACLIIVLYLLFSISKSRHWKEKFLISGAMLIFLRMALRSVDIGSDLIRYRIRYLGIISSNDSIWGNFYGEPLYVLANRICGRISEENGYRIFLTVCAFWVIFSFAFLIHQYSDHLLVSFFVYFALDFYLFAFSGLRQAIAMAFIMWAFHFIVKKKLIPFLLMVLLATGFHRTAIVFSVCYLVQYFKWTRWRILLAVILGGTILYNIEEIGKVIILYVGSEFEHFASSGTIGTMSLLIMSFLLIGFLFNSPVRNREIENVVLNNIMIISLIVQMLSFVSYNFTRLNLYFFQFSVLYVANTADKLDKRGKKLVFTEDSKKICIALLIAALFVVYISWLSISPYDVVPYQYFWSDV